MLGQVEKGPHLYEELENRIISIKGQVELELDMQVKEFQKIVQAEKQ